VDVALFKPQAHKLKHLLAGVICLVKYQDNSSTSSILRKKPPNFKTSLCFLLFRVSWNRFKDCRILAGSGNKLAL